MSINDHYAVFNPLNKPPEDLPVIWGFTNGGQPGWLQGCLVTDDGQFLGSHVCSSESFMHGDLGIETGARPDRHEAFQKHYPDGYRMDFVLYADVAGHAGIQKAFAAAKASAPQETPE